jgi:hypothetical protein
MARKGSLRAYNRIERNPEIPNVRELLIGFRFEFPRSNWITRPGKLRIARDRQDEAVSTPHAGRPTLWR